MHSALSIRSVQRGKAYQRYRKQPLRPVFAFSLKVIDASGAAEVLCFDREAEHLLGTSAATFRRNGGVRDAVQEALEHCVDSQLPMDMYLWSYQLPLAKDPAGAQGRDKDG